MKKIFIYGCGNNGKKIIRMLRWLNIRAAAFIDNDAEKQGKNIEGYNCVSLHQAINMGAREGLIVVSPDKNEEIIRCLEKEHFTNYVSIKEAMGKINFLVPDIYQEDDYKYAMPFNHYEAPYPNIIDIHRKEEEIYSEHEIADIDFNDKRQLELIEHMLKIEAPVWQTEKSDFERYYSNNPMFSCYNADILYYMMRILSPKRIIEVGSGFSTSVMLDVNEKHFNNEIDLHSIEPYPQRLKSLLRETDNLEIMEKGLQDVPVEFFQQLKENDILFIDSSHVAKMDSDVNYLFFEILPKLNQGVYIHIHDVFYQFTYPKEWVYQGRVYNEMYLLRAFLMNNTKYSIQWYGDYMTKKYSQELGEKLANCGVGTFWMKKN